MSDLPKHILIIRLSAMGDVAMTVPVIRAFNEQYPTVKITVLTRSFFSPFFRDLKNVTVFNAEVKEKHKGIFGIYKLSKELKKLQIDAIADLHNVLRSKILKVFFFGTKFIQVDKGRSEKKALISKSVFKQLKTTHQRYVDVFQNLGFNINLNNPSFPTKKELNTKIKDKTGEKEQKWIGIAPFAQYSSKMYPLELMEKVIENLSQKNKVLLFGGGKKEVKILTDFEKKYKNTINLAGKLSLNEELDIISNLDIMLSMDSGNGHIAAMLGINVISIWGVTHPFAGFIPFNQKIENSLVANRKQYHKIPTSVYGNKYPEGYENAAGSITPEAVIDKISSILK